MEKKKTSRADLEQQRATAFLLGLAVVLSLLFVALEWDSSVSDAGVQPLNLDELLGEDELVPMSNDERLVELKPQQEEPKPTERLRVVEDNTELQADTEQAAPDEGDDAATPPPAKDDDQPEALAPLGVDMDNNPLNFRVVEDLPQFPGGAVELMKWLTRNLRYPPTAQKRRVQGRVVAQFYIEANGSVTGISITEPLTADCDDEALRVLRMMPKWKPGMQMGRPCRTKVCIPIVFKL